MYAASQFLAAAWRFLGLRGVLALALLGTTAWYRFEAVDNANEALAAEAKASQAQATITQLQASYAEQTKAVRDLAAETASMKQQIVDAQEANTKTAQRTVTELVRIRNASIPTTCAGAVEWAKTEAAAFAKRWGERK